MILQTLRQQPPYGTSAVGEPQAMQNGNVKHTEGTRAVSKIIHVVQIPSIMRVVQESFVVDGCRVECDGLDTTPSAGSNVFP